MNEEAWEALEDYFIVNWVVPPKKDCTYQEMYDKLHELIHQEIKIHEDLTKREGKKDYD